MKIPFNVREVFGKGRVPVCAVFDWSSYDGQLANMGNKNADGSVYHILGIRKDIRAQIGKQPGDTVPVAKGVILWQSSEKCLETLIHHILLR